MKDSTMKTKAYSPTDPNAVFAAGQRVPEDRVLYLTDDEARYEMLAGNLVAVGDTTPPPATAPAARKTARD